MTAITKSRADIPVSSSLIIRASDMLRQGGQSVHIFILKQKPKIEVAGHEALGA